MPVGGNQILAGFIKTLAIKVIDYSVFDEATSRVSITTKQSISYLIQKYPTWVDDEVIMVVFPELAKILSGYLDIVHMSVFNKHAPTSLLYPTNVSSPLEYTGPEKQSGVSCILINKVLILLYRIACLAAFRKTGNNQFVKCLELITPETNIPNSVIADIVFDIIRGLYDSALGAIQRISQISNV